MPESARLCRQKWERRSKVTARGYTFTATGTYRRLGVPTLEAVNVGGGPNRPRPGLTGLGFKVAGTARVAAPAWDVRRLVDRWRWGA
ncbi:MAG: hypothetical protein HYY95_07880 [Candidatus Rokubacteria bacterium]|nr:hypothetical protein [Candidatus Rokubacteria bacterium]